MNWQLNKIQYPVYNLGEGKRIGIWVQGCSLGCKGCVNKTIWGKTGGKSIPVLDVFNWVASNENSFDGLTISGGEPFQQYEQLIAFLHLIKTKTNLTVQCFSGYYLAELVTLFPDKLFLKYINTLVDGRYIENQNENEKIKGSSNQSIYNFVDSIPIKQEIMLSSSNKWSVNLDKDNNIYMAGIPGKNELNNLCKELKKVGLNKKFK